MRQSEVLSILRDHLADLRAMGVVSLALFGSVARDDARESSDVDVLLDLDRPATFDGFMNIKLRLEEWLGTRVDVVTRKALRPRMRQRIEAEAIRVA